MKQFPAIVSVGLTDTNELNKLLAAILWYSKLTLLNTFVETFNGLVGRTFEIICNKYVPIEEARFLSSKLFSLEIKYDTDDERKIQEGMLIFWGEYFSEIIHTWDGIMSQERLQEDSKNIVALLRHKTGWTGG